MASMLQAERSRLSPVATPMVCKTAKSEFPTSKTITYVKVIIDDPPLNVVIVVATFPDPPVIRLATTFSQSL
jgi:hypothetical protein